MSELVVTEQNFDESVLKSTQPVLLDFWAPWCGPCRMLSPVIDEIAKDYAGRLVVGKVNTDENLNLASRFQIVSIPTILIFKAGALAERLVGFKSKADLKKLIDGLL